MTYQNAQKKPKIVEKTKAAPKPKLVNPGKHTAKGKMPLPPGAYGMSEGGAKKNKRGK